MNVYLRLYKQYTKTLPIYFVMLLVLIGTIDSYGQSSTCASTDTYYILSDELTKTTHIINFATNTEVSSTSCLGTATGGEGVAVDATNNFVYIASNSFIQKYNVVTGVVVSTYTPTNVTVNAIHQIALSPNKQFLYVSLTRVKMQAIILMVEMFWCILPQPTL